MKMSLNTKGDSNQKMTEVLSIITFTTVITKGENSKV